ncbi:MAG: cytochrome c biogenesis protein CcsA, partial [Candidatus Poribacteria bacterium]|nr:cytochrome c biogenesis protein CcsA [Candidatus Poribacteria bacterium]
MNPVVVEIGRAATYLAFAASLWAVGSLTFGLATQRAGWVLSGRRAVVTVFGMELLAAALLIHALVNNWWQVAYVWRTSLDQQPLIYKFGALWGGMSGSMLFWTLLLTLCGAWLVFRSRDEDDDLSNHALAALSVVILFFSVLAAGFIPGVANPFTYLLPHEIAAVESGQAVRGMGLNPLLQTPLMLIHPPHLYGGFVTATVPFAYALAALISGSGSTQWLVRSRRWTLISWLLLTLGNLFGGAWAYGELGWGGYWGWDPVENAALLPWLLITAFLHSVMIQEHRNMLKMWNIVLISSTFLLIMFGTTLVRSGLLSSVHAFGQSTELLVYFLGFTALTAAVVTWLIVKRWDTLKSPNAFDSLLSREAAFLLNNWIFVVSAVVVFAGTTFPILSEAYYTWFKGIEDRKIAVSEPYYNQFVVPLGLILLFLTGIGPLISWKKATPSNLRRNFLLPAAVGGIAGALSLIPFVMIGQSDPDGVPVLKTVYAALCVYASVFVLTTVVDEFWKGAKVRLKRGASNPLQAFVELVRRNKRRYGGYTVHIGVVLFYLGVLGSKGFQVSHRLILQPGESAEVGGYTLTVGQPFEERVKNAWYVGSNIAIAKGGKSLATLKPARGFYDNNEDATYESAILRRWDGDLYIALGEMTEAGQADMQIFYN